MNQRKSLQLKYFAYLDINLNKPSNAIPKQLFNKIDGDAFDDTEVLSKRLYRPRRSVIPKLNEALINDHYKKEFTSVQSVANNL
jgi:hypothetical protein